MTSHRHINEAGISLIKKFEGLSLKAYLCPANVLTIGYGHVSSSIKQGDVITQAEADEFLSSDLSKFCKGVEDCVKVPITDNQFASLVSFAYNVGISALRNSTLLKKLNAKDYEGAGDEFLRWTKAGGKTLPGLVNRRAAERKLFITAASGKISSY